MSEESIDIGNNPTGTPITTDQAAIIRNSLGFGSTIGANTILVGSTSAAASFQTAFANRFPARASTGNLAMKLISDNALNFLTFDYSGMKNLLSLGNVDNTSDANKPVSTATQTALNAKANLTGGNTISGAQTLTGQVDLTGQDANAATRAMTRTLVRRELRTLDGMLADADAVVNVDNYTSHLAMGSAALGRTSSPDSDGIVNGWISVHNSARAYYSNQDGIYFVPGNGNGEACGISFRPPTPNGNGIVRGDSGFRVNIAVNISMPRVFNDANTMVGREVFFGLGSLTTGTSAALTKGGCGIGFGHTSDYIQFWNGTAWSDTSLRWKNGSSLLVSRLHAQLVSQSSQVVMQVKDSSSSTWITAGTVSGSQYGVTSAVLAHQVISGSPSAGSSNQYFSARNVSYATN